MSNDSIVDKWDYPAHTKAKHDILAYYLDGWYPIISKYNGRVLFLDGFAGRGRYNDGTYGSPIIALQHLLNHSYFPRMADREFAFIFVEKDKENARSLQYEIDQFKISRAPWPGNVKTEVVNAAFDETASSILGYLREQKSQLAPTFAFVDPFGYSGLPMELLGELLASPATEVLVNFMVGHVQRFIERDGQERAMKSLFGKDVTEILAEYDSGSRIQHLREVYANQLKQVAKFGHVNSFEMINSTGNVGYFLFHGTRHPMGVKLMKAAMWRVDPGGGYSFSDRLAGQNVLFQQEPNLRPLREALAAHYCGQRVLIDDIEWFTVLETPYRETHVRKALTSLERDGLIDVERPGKSGFPVKKTYVSFA